MNLISQRRSDNLSFDHHKVAPYENLYTDLDAGEGTRLLVSGGGTDLGHHTAAGATFWNIHGRHATSIAPGFGPAWINFVGAPVSEAATLEAEGRWIEHFTEAGLVPANLHDAMLRRRLDARSFPSPPFLAPPASSVPGPVEARVPGSASRGRTQAATPTS